MTRGASGAPGRRGAPGEAGGPSCRSDVTQNSRTARTRRRGEIPWPPQHRLMAEERERDRLFGLAVEEHLIEEHDWARLDLRRQPLDERGVLRASTRDHDLSAPPPPVVLSRAPPRDRAT